MKIKTNKIGLLVCTLSLSACGMMKPYDDTSYYSPYSFGQSDHTATAPLYPDGYDNTSGGAYTPGSRERVVTVPESYHVNSESAPASFKDREKSWVGRQNAQNYTIQLDDSEKASQVADILQKAPKDARRAEVKYHQDGEQRYRGVYGTYSSYEAAQKAMSNLPSHLKSNAKVKTWGSVQSTAGE
jgi:septal ring-binding cell division protein DamX